jgi:predicted permease
VIVVSDKYWRAQLSAASDVIGQTIGVNGLAYGVVGVAPAVPSLGFFGTSAAAWVPAATADSLLNAGWRTNADDRAFVALTHAATGTTAVQLDTQLQRATQALAMDFHMRWTDRRLKTEQGLLVTGSLRDAAALASALLGGMAALILVVAAANVGGLMFAQWSARRRSTAIRSALGASRGALVAQMLCEGVTLGLAGGGLALLMYLWFARAASAVTLLPTLELNIELPVTWSLSVLTLGLSVLAGILMTLAPALAATRRTTTMQLGNMTGRQVGHQGASRSRQWLLGAQLAASLVLIVLAALFSRSLTAMHDLPLGVDVDRIAAFDLDIEPVGVPPEARSALVAEAMTRVGALPDIAAVAMASRAPVDASTPSGEIRFRGEAGEVMIPDVTRLEITTAYFDVVGLPLLRGRTFTTSDAGRDVVMVNDTLARRLSGASFMTDAGSGRQFEVIGVVPDARYRSVTEPPQPHFYLPVTPQFHLALLIRTPGDPQSLFGDVQRELDSAGPGIQGFFPRTGRDQLAVDLLTTSTAATMARILGVLAACLAIIGLYGVLMWMVQARMPELGLRQALGATAADIRRFVFRQALRGAWPGIAAGLGCAGLAAWALRGQWFGITALDPVVLIVVPATQLVIVLLAGIIPARRAARASAVDLLR